MIALRLFLLAILIASPLSARAQSLVFATSDPTVWIHSNFTGETITLFGNVEPDIAGTAPEGPFDVLIVVRGPVADRVVRRQARQFGIMLNADYALYSRLPSFYHVLSSRPLEAIIDPDILETRNIAAPSQLGSRLTRTTGNVPLFHTQSLRLLQQAGLYRTDERAVSFLSPTFFATRVTLPANVPNGSFLAHTFVLKDSEIVAERTQRFFVQKTGFERFVGDTARSQPVLYGIATVLLALFTGWLGGVLFRR